MKRPRLIAVVFGAAVALIVSLVAIVFTSEIGTLVYLIGIAILSTLLLGIAFALRRGRRQRLTSVAAFGAFLIVAVGVLISQRQIRPHLLWLVWSNRYKSEVLANSAAANGEFKHVEGDGDGWGSGVTGDWMGYVVFDPSDSLLAATKKNVPTEYRGIPCKVILMRRLEKQWYSVVLDMNQFWDKMHRGADAEIISDITVEKCHFTHLPQLASSQLRDLG